MTPRSFGALLLVSTAAAADIHEAVRADDPLKVQDALEAGENINKIGPGGQTPLMHGVLQGKLSAVEALLSAGAVRRCTPERAQH